MTSREQILEREERFALPAAIAAVAAVVLGIVVPLLATNLILDGTGDAAFLRSIEENSGAYLAVQLGAALGFLLLIFPLTYLFKAAAARSESVRPGLIGVIYVSPVLLAVATVVMTLVSMEAASDFVAAGIVGEDEIADEAARALREEQGTAFSLAIGLITAGRLGFAVGMAYTAYHAMKTGLLTRFWGSLGAALGAASFLFMEFALAWFVYLGLLIAGWIPGGRPPAWEAGVAMPWPKPGEDEQGIEEEEGAFEAEDGGLGDEWEEARESREMEYRDPAEPGGPAVEGDAGDVPPAPAPSRSTQKRKRKRRD